MPIESATYLSDLNPSYPASTDLVSLGDDHLRLVKQVLQNTFPAVAGTVLPSHTELNYVDGVTSSIQTQLAARATSTSGSYTPTATAISNVTSVTVQAATYIRVGNVVQLSVYCTVTPTASSGGQFYLTLPVASALAAVSDASGMLNGSDAAHAFTGMVCAEPSGDRLDCVFVAATTSATPVCVSAQYTVI